MTTFMAGTAGAAFERAYFTRRNAVRQVKNIYFRAPATTAFSRDMDIAAWVSASCLVISLL